MKGRFRTSSAWPLLFAAALVVAVLAPSCSSGDKRDRGSEESEALVANMLDLAARIPDIPSEMSTRGNSLSAAERADLERLGVLAWKIRDRATAAAAFDAAAKIERIGVDAVSKGGGQIEPNGSTLTLGGAPIATTTWDARRIRDGWRSNGGPDGRLEGGDPPLTLGPRVRHQTAYDPVYPQRSGDPRSVRPESRSGNAAGNSPHQQRGPGRLPPL